MFSAKAKVSAHPPSQAEQPDASANDEAIVRRFLELQDEERGLREAASLLRNPSDRNSERTIKTRAFAAPYMELASRPLALATRREQIAVELEKLQPLFAAALDRQAIARSVSTSDIAIKKQPRQKAAVLKIAAAAEALSRAMAEEKAVREELAREAPLPTSRYLPMSSPYIGGLDDWASELSQWRRRMKALGYLT